jgi:hypothetical protein
MTTATPSNSALTAIADLAFPAAGTIGYAILLKPDLALGLGMTVNPATDMITTTTAHGLFTGSRVRIASTTTLPTPLSAATDYYAIVASPTTLLLADTLAHAQSSTQINLVDAGSGTLTLNEQQVTSADSIQVLVNKELTNANGYARMPLTNTGAASLVAGNGEKNTTVVFTNNGAANIDYISTLVAFGASNAIGSTAGITSYWVAPETSTQTTVPGQTRSITVAMRIKPA